MKWKERRETFHAKQNPQFIFYSSQTVTVFSLQFFSMIYQAMEQTVGICDSLLTSQKQSIHVRATKTWQNPSLGVSTPTSAATALCQDAPNQKQDRCIQLIPARVNMPNSSLAVYLLCVYMHTQTITILKWLSAHTETALEAEKLQPCALCCTDLSPAFHTSSPCLENDAACFLHGCGWRHCRRCIRLGLWWGQWRFLSDRGELWGLGWVVVPNNSWRTDILDSNLLSRGWSPSEISWSPWKNKSESKISVGDSVVPHSALPEIDVLGDFKSELRSTQQELSLNQYGLNYTV